MEKELLPIPVEILEKRSMIPMKLAELSYNNPDKAIELLRVWGEKRMPITPLFDEIMDQFDHRKEA
ncbi:hypothetical protein [Alkalihalobacterium alkalinitrilicum]|uniref:hypothetical protein n=1 Tax=Alkalihalobacterium alkalinitrilicum TaxID=427920 RepID=UPI0009951817|nr:hypothetical protein [Alkalihalobacterium alkalinitrilicum]